MTITQLKYVLAVSEYKNFTRAAEHVFVTQPTLSMQIQKLEEILIVNGVFFNKYVFIKTILFGRFLFYDFDRNINIV